MCQCGKPVESSVGQTFLAGMCSYEVVFLGHRTLAAVSWHRFDDCRAGVFGVVGVVGGPGGSAMGTGECSQLFFVLKLFGVLWRLPGAAADTWEPAASGRAANHSVRKASVFWRF